MAAEIPTTKLNYVMADGFSNYCPRCERFHPLPWCELVTSVPADSSALPTPDEIKADPDRILELYDCCPKCGGTALEALTWKSIGSDDVTIGCWNPDCDWWITPPGYVPPDAQNDSTAPR